MFTPTLPPAMVMFSRPCRPGGRARLRPPALRSPTGWPAAADAAAAEGPGGTSGDDPVGGRSGRPVSRRAAERGPCSPSSTPMLPRPGLPAGKVGRVLAQGAISATLGLIGSSAKRAQFESRLKADGFTGDDLARPTCPIGMPQLKDKAPAVIAVSVAAAAAGTDRRRRGVSFDWGAWASAGASAGCT